MTTCRLSVSPGNSKLGRIPSISFPTRECPTQCDYCYARNIERRYPTVARAWAGNAWYFREHPEAEIVETIRHEIAGAGLFRWLVGGEFSNRAFVVAQQLAFEMHNTLFMSYTKRKELGALPRPDNLVLLYSYPYIETDPCCLEEADASAREWGFDGASMIFYEYTNCKHQLLGITCAECQECFHRRSLAIRLHK